MNKLKQKSFDLATQSYIKLLNDFGLYPFRIQIFYTDKEVEDVQVDSYECEEVSR